MEGKKHHQLKTRQLELKNRPDFPDKKQNTASFLSEIMKGRNLMKEGRRGELLHEELSGEETSNSKKMRDKLLRLLNKYRSLILSFLDEISDGAAFLAPEGECLLINKNAGSILGMDPEAPLGADFINSIPDPDMRSIIRESIKLCSEHGCHSKELHFSDFTYRLKAVQLSDEKDNSTGTAIFLSNISSQMELDKKKDEFIALISHELRTPLTIIKGYLDITAQEIFGPLNSELKHSVKIMQEQCHSLDLILTDLIRFGMMNKGEISITPEAITIFPFLREYIELFETKLKSARMTAALEIPDPHLTCFCDKEHFRDLIRHLLDNAIKFAGEKSKITVKASAFDLEELPPGRDRIIKAEPSPRKKWVKIEVVDDGRGIDKSKISKIFESFEQAEDYMTRSAAGLGLGLALVKKTIEIYRGTLWIKTSKGKGTSVAFLLPLIDRVIEK